jgi:hypothetical protein
MSRTKETILVASAALFASASLVLAVTYAIHIILHYTI